MGMCCFSASCTHLVNVGVESWDTDEVQGRECRWGAVEELRTPQYLYLLMCVFAVQLILLLSVPWWKKWKAVWFVEEEKHWGSPDDTLAVLFTCYCYSPPCINRWRDLSCAAMKSREWLLLLHLLLWKVSNAVTSSHESFIESCDGIKWGSPAILAASLSRDREWKWRVGAWEMSCFFSFSHLFLCLIWWFSVKLRTTLSPEVKIISRSMSLSDKKWITHSFSLSTTLIWSDYPHMITLSHSPPVGSSSAEDNQKLCWFPQQTMPLFNSVCGLYWTKTCLFKRCWNDLCSASFVFSRYHIMATDVWFSLGGYI